VSIDMEESQHTAATLALYEAEQRRTGNLGVAMQAYLHRTGADLQRIIPLGGHVRLCKGAYREPASIAFTRKRDVDASFDVLAAVLMAAAAVRPALATHDEERIDRSLRHARHRPAGSFEFQMLYGVRGRLQDRLLAEGHSLRVYVPYGVAWYPYLTRRLAERPANVVFFLRALLGR
jgi:proline dehydrogenase